MKKCPFCAEDIQDAAVKCRYCGSTLPSMDPGAPACLPDVQRLIAEGKKINAIKLLRDETQWDLKSAKDYVEGLTPQPSGASSQPVSTSAKPTQTNGCAVALAIAIVVAILVWWNYSPSSSPAQSNLTTIAAMEVDAGTIVEAYKNNEIAADNTYKGRTVRVSGLVDSIGKDILDSPYVVLGTGQEYEVRRVQCVLAKGAEARAATLAKGSRISLTGEVRGLMMNVLLDGCRFD